MRIVILTGCLSCSGCASWNAYHDAMDRDEDGWPFPEDCYPDDPTMHPGAEDFCGNGLDEDCSGDQLQCGFERLTDLSQAPTLVGPEDGWVGASMVVVPGWCEGGDDALVVADAQGRRLYIVTCLEEVATRLNQLEAGNLEEEADFVLEADNDVASLGKALAVVDLPDGEQGLAVSAIANDIGNVYFLRSPYLDGWQSGDTVGEAAWLRLRGEEAHDRAGRSLAARGSIGERGSWLAIGAPGTESVLSTTKGPVPGPRGWSIC